jgi:hypothetical protein
MILFQIDNFNLFHYIKDLKVAIKEDLQTSSVDSSYYEGDYRSSKNRNKKITLSVNGYTKSQHFLHSLRAMSEYDESRGDIKAFWIEKYDEFNQDYNTLSDTELEKKKYRLSFNYVYIDIIAENPIYLNNQELRYLVNFEISLVYPNAYDISNSSNAFYVTEESRRNTEINIYDSNVIYDSGYTYDNFLQSLLPDTNRINAKNANLEIWFKDLTCCSCNDNNLIFFVDNVIKPFGSQNYTTSQGVISRNILSESFDNTKETTNYLQTYLANPQSQLQLNLNNLSTPFKANLDPTTPLVIRNIEVTTNTWSTNSIIQIWRKSLSNLSSLSGTKPVFDASGQSITITIQNSLNYTSSFKVICYSSYLLANLSGLVIHTHTQKLYGFLTPKNNQMTSTKFFWEQDSVGLVDLESYLLSGDLQVWNESLDGVQEWFRISPRYKKSIYDSKGQDTLTFTVSYNNPNQNLPNGDALVLQIYTLNENKQF